jgi:drug/metabolite transporter (DMT)-like permease
LYTVLGRRVVAQVGSLRMNAYSFLFGSLMTIPLLLLLDIPVFQFDVTILPQILYLSIFVTGIAYLTYFMGLAQAGASKGSLVFFLKPIFASFIAVIFLGERLDITLIAGTVLVLAGIAVALFGDKLRARAKVA